MQLIMFLSRLLTAAEANYQPIELEIAGFVQVIKKVRHMIRVFTAQGYYLNRLLRNTGYHEAVVDYVNDIYPEAQYSACSCFAIPKTISP